MSQLVQVQTQLVQAQRDVDRRRGAVSPSLWLSDAVWWYDFDMTEGSPGKNRNRGTGMDGIVFWRASDWVQRSMTNALSAHGSQVTVIVKHGAGALKSKNGAEVGIGVVGPASTQTWSFCAWIRRTG